MCDIPTAEVLFGGFVFIFAVVITGITAYMYGKDRGYLEATEDHNMMNEG